MAIRVKRGGYGARLGPLPAVVVLFIVVDQVLTEYRIRYEISSGREGEHIPGSLHWLDLAFDFKLFDMQEQKAVIKISPGLGHLFANEIGDRLGDDYDSLFNEEKNIIHVEIQPKRSLGKLPT